MKVASVVGSASVSSSEGHKIFKPVHKIIVVQKISNLSAASEFIDTTNDDLKIPIPHLSARYIDNLNNPEIVSMTPLDVLSEISTKQEGYMRKMVRGYSPDDDLTSYEVSGSNIFCLTLNDTSAVRLSNERYLSIDLSNLKAGFTYDIYGFEYPIISDFCKRYVKQFLPSQDLEKTFNVAQYDYIALPIQNLSEIQLFNKTGLNSVVFTAEELKIDQDLSNDLSFVGLDNENVCRGFGFANGIVATDDLDSMSTFRADIRIPIDFSYKGYSLISLSGIDSFNIKRLASENNFEFFLIDSL